MQLRSFFSALYRACCVRFYLVWLGFCTPLLLIALLYKARKPVSGLSDFFLFRAGDLITLVMIAVFFVILSFPKLQIKPQQINVLSKFIKDHAHIVCLILALVAGVFAFVGWFVVMQTYPLSMDEFAATFDMRAFLHGNLTGKIPADWREYTKALQPYFFISTPNHQFWFSQYLPVNAFFRSLFAYFGSETLTGPFWVILSLIMIYQIARKLWPDDSHTVVITTLFMATSSQVLLNGMTPYAMPAHLALNLCWLRLYLNNNRLSDGLALVIAFAACGLHQLAFHPLFAAPFILRLWMKREWMRAGFYSIIYLGIATFWTHYPGFALELQGVPPDLANHLGATSFWKSVTKFLAEENPWRGLYMAENGLRFAAWQNPMMIVLAILALPAIVFPQSKKSSSLGSSGIIRSCVAGILFTLIAVTILMPYQGHGWGYRYLHGLIGNICLIAGFGWRTIVFPGRLGAESEISHSDHASNTISRIWTGVFGSSLFSVLVLIPINMIQAHDFIDPYARAYRSITASRTDIILMFAPRKETTYAFFAKDLVRNDPFLRNRPVILDISNLSEQQIDHICHKYSVSLFTPQDAVRFGIVTNPIILQDPELLQKQRLLQSYGCAIRHVKDLS